MPYSNMNHETGKRFDGIDYIILCEDFNKSIKRNSSLRSETADIHIKLHPVVDLSKLHEIDTLIDLEFKYSSHTNISSDISNPEISNPDLYGFYKETVKIGTKKAEAYRKERLWWTSYIKMERKRKINHERYIKRKYAEHTKKLIIAKRNKIRLDIIESIWRRYMVNYYRSRYLLRKISLGPPPKLYHKARPSAADTELDTAGRARCSYINPKNNHRCKYRVYRSREDMLRTRYCMVFERRLIKKEKGGFCGLHGK